MDEGHPHDTVESQPPAFTKPTKRGEGVYNVGLKLSNKLHSFFYRYGQLVGTYPVRVIVLSVVVVGICSLGLFKLEAETRITKLWVHTDNKAQRDKKVVDNVYGNGKSSSLYRIAQLLITVDQNQDMLQPVHFDRLRLLNKALTAVKATYQGTVYTFDDLCNKRGGACYTFNILQLFNDDPTEWSSREQILAGVNSNTTSFNVNRALGGITYDAAGQIAGAKYVSAEYWLDNNEEKVGDDYVDRKAEAWEKEWLDLAEAAGNNDVDFLDWTIYRRAARSWSDEFDRALDADIGWMPVAFTLSILYACFMLSRWSKGYLGFRGLVVLGGILSIGMALVAAYGLCVGVGLMFTPLMSAMPFLLLGLGVDDMFVIIHCLDSLPEEESLLSVPERMALTLAKAGPSITLTSLTDCLGFLLGSNTALPALSKFSVYCGVGILFDFLLQITFFCAVLALDMRSKQAGQGDLMCCCSPLNPVSERSYCGYVKKDDFTLQRAVSRFLAEPMVRKPVKAFVLVGFAAIGGGGLWGAMSIKTEMEIRDFLPKGSYLEAFYEKDDKHFSIGTSTAVYIDRGVEYSNPTVWPKMHELCDAFRSTRFVGSDTVECWFQAFAASWEGAPLQRGAFYVDLQRFLGSPEGHAYARDVVFEANSTSSIRTSRLTGYHDQLLESSTRAKSMDYLRQSVAGTALAREFGDVRVFAYSTAYIHYETYKSIEKDATMNLTLAVAGMSVIVLIIVVNPTAAALTVGSIGLAVMNIVGYMYWWGL
eukprot:CAMPEP_0118947786 /NCGR_PEP_ID=MMETSP1169-20130426/46651_1 /TAXON_ID=36882 /ORGANISM="Pyramimonas obovata, Strain CCMP722" /LENGTH=761 /DNA_ID=CAMNT_0006894069 /DNA_START=130 /DNA_END=2412 /DNA_ORIENTATION=+